MAKLANLYTVGRDPSCTRLHVNCNPPFLFLSLKTARSNHKFTSIFPLYPSRPFYPEAPTGDVLESDDTSPSPCEMTTMI